jgi:hypothetical protein
MKADDLIKRATKGSTLAPPSAAGMRELKRVLAYNDTAPWRSKVSATDAIKLLREHGWQGVSRAALDTLCATLGRRTYGTP